MIPVLKCTVRNFVLPFFFRTVEVPLSKRSVKVPIAFINTLRYLTNYVLGVNLLYFKDDICEGDIVASTVSLETGSCYVFQNRNAKSWMFEGLTENYFTAVWPNESCDGDDEIFYQEEADRLCQAFDEESDSF